MTGCDQPPPTNGGGPVTAPPPPDGTGARRRRRQRPWQQSVFGVVAALLTAAPDIGAFARCDAPARFGTPAAADLLHALSPGTAERRYGIDVPVARRATVMRGWDFGVKVTGHSEVDHFDRDGTVYGPADGHRLYTLALTGTDGERVGARSRNTTLRVRIGADERPLRDAGTLADGERLVLLVSVPEAAGTAQLVLGEPGLSQTVSLTTGAAGDGNPEVLGREHVTSGPMLRTGTLRYRLSSSATAVTLRRTARYRLTSARLSYRHLHRQDEHAARDSAFLFLTGSMTRTGKVRGLPPQWMSLRLPDGAVRTAGAHSDHTGYRWLAFEVPADFTRGTLVFGGEDRFPGTDNPHGVTLTVETEKEEPLAIGRGLLTDAGHRDDDA
ncbi:hypothetical protein [Streptomyces sparsus]